MVLLPAKSKSGWVRGTPAYNQRPGIAAGAEGAAGDYVGFGIMGGSNQPLAHAQFVSNVVDYGMNVQAAVEAPRFTIHGESLNCDIAIESRVKPEVLDGLRRKGHNLNVRQEYSSWMGRGQAVLYNSKTGVNFAGSDPRADGAAVPEPVPQPPK